MANEDHWSIEGTLVLRDALLDLGVVPASVTGRITGTMSSKAGKTSLKAATRINSMLIKKPFSFSHCLNRFCRIPFDMQ